MKLPRHLSGEQLIRCLAKLGYFATRQSGIHVRLTCQVPVQHHITVPLHNPLKVGTLAAILADVAQTHGYTREALGNILFST